MQNTAQNIAENNKLMAEFLGNTETHIKNFGGIEKTKYHSDWNWLMSVVEKIESFEYLVEIRENVCFIKTSEQDYFSELENTKIKAVYNACVKFIKWYNQK